MISNSRTDFILHMRFVRHSIGNRTMKLHSTLLCFLCGVFNSPGFGTSSRGNRVMFTFCRSGRVRRYPDCMLLTSFAMEILARRKLGQWEIERHSCAPCCYLYKCCRCLSARQFRIYVSTYLWVCACRCCWCMDDGLNPHGPENGGSNCAFYPVAWCSHGTSIPMAIGEMNMMMVHAYIAPYIQRRLLHAKPTPTIPNWFDLPYFVCSSLLCCWLFFPLYFATTKCRPWVTSAQRTQNSNNRRTPMKRDMKLKGSKNKRRTKSATTKPWFVRCLPCVRMHINFFVTWTCFIFAFECNLHILRDCKF